MLSSFSQSFMGISLHPDSYILTCSLTGNENVVEVLIENNADVNSKDNRNQSMLEYALTLSAYRPGIE